MSDSEKSIEAKQQPKESASASVAEDPELDDLLDSALPDFEKHAATTKSKTEDARNTTAPSQHPPTEGDGAPDDLLSGVADDAAKQFQDAMKDLMDNDPQMMQQFEQLFQAAGNINTNSQSQEEFAATLQQTLGSLSENAQDLGPGEGEGDLSEDDIMRMMSGMGLGGADGDSMGGDHVMPLMQTMMKSLMSKEVLYPSLKEISEKYPGWIEENTDKCEPNDLVRYKKQLDLMKGICAKFEEEKDADSEQVKMDRFANIMSMMQDMQDCGQPPKDIVGEMAPGLEFDGDGMPKIPGMEGCTVM